MKTPVQWQSGLVRNQAKARTLFNFVFFTATCMLLSGCTELGEMVVTRIKILNSSSVHLADFDTSDFPKKGMGSSDSCLARRGDVGFMSMAGVCFDSKDRELIIYRALPNKFEIAKKGITVEAKNSVEYRELEKLREIVESVLRKHSIPFSSSQERFEPFETLIEEVNLRR